MNNCKGIIINNIRFKDTSIISNIYTSEHGKIPFLIRGIKNPKKKEKIFPHPFTIINFQFNKKESRSVQVLNKFEIELYPVNIIGNPIKSALTLFLSETLYRVIKEEEKNEPLFNYLETSVKALNKLNEGTANFHIFFLIHLAFHLGFMPLNNYSENQKYFDLQEGKFVYRTNENTLTETLSKIIYLLINFDIISIKNIKINRIQRTELLKRIWKYYQLHLPGVGEIKSLEVLNDIFT